MATFPVKMATRWRLQETSIETKRPSERLVHRLCSLTFVMSEPSCQSVSVTWCHGTLNMTPLTCATTSHSHFTVAMVLVVVSSPPPKKKNKQTQINFVLKWVDGVAVLISRSSSHVSLVNVSR